MTDPRLHAARRSAAAAALLLVALLLPACSSPFYHPVREVKAPAALARFPWSDLSFPAPDNVTLTAWRIDPPAGTPCRGTILFLHGNAGNLSNHVGVVAWLAAEGFRVVALDYRGYGRSGGEPSPEGLVRDGEALLDLLPTLPGVERERIAVFGQSLGGAVAVPVVARAKGRVPVKALVTEGAFAGYRRIVRDKLASTIVGWPLAWPVSLLFDDAWSPERYAAAVAPVPFVVVHGTKDPVVPFSHGERLASLAGEPKGFWVIPGGGHGNAFEGEDVRRQFTAFLSAAFEGRLPPPTP